MVSAHRGLQEAGGAGLLLGMGANTSPDSREQSLGDSQHTEDQTGGEYVSRSSFLGICIADYLLYPHLSTINVTQQSHSEENEHHSLLPCCSPGRAAQEAGAEPSTAHPEHPTLLLPKVLPVAHSQNRQELVEQGWGW